MIKIFISRLALILGLLLFAIQLNAQSNPANEKYDKIISLIQKDKIDAADKKLVKLLEEFSSYGKGWDLLAKIRNYQYEESKKLPDLFSNLTVVTKDSLGNEIESDSLEESLMSVLKQMSPEKKAYNNYIYTLRQAMLYSNNAYLSSMYLRIALRDEAVDTNLGEKELSYFNKAEKEFGERNYDKAAKYYKRALEINPDFYKAALYLGDSYYLMENYVEAIKKFKVCVNRFPDYLEPRKYLVDAYYYEGLHEKALEEAINCMAIYPDLVTKLKLEDAAFELNKKPSFSWESRGVFPNVFNGDSIQIVDNENQPVYDYEAYWDIYEAAIDRVKEFSSEDGIIKDGNEYSPYTYVELYGWEKMLEKSDHPSLETAKKMKQLGYLDCYVMVSRFHDDFYTQYIDFAKNNKKKIIDYYNNIVLESL